MTHERKYGRYTQVCTTGLTGVIFSSLISSARNTLNVKPNSRLYRLMSTVFLNARMKFGSTIISRKCSKPTHGLPQHAEAGGVVLECEQNAVHGAVVEHDHEDSPGQHQQ